MNYMCNKYVFKTEEEANMFRNWLMGKTGYVCAISYTLKRVTHTFNANDTNYWSNDYYVYFFNCFFDIEYFFKR